MATSLWFTNPISALSPKCVTVPKKSLGLMKFATALTEMLHVGSRGVNLNSTVKGRRNVTYATSRNLSLTQIPRCSIQAPGG